MYTCVLCVHTYIHTCMHVLGEWWNTDVEQVVREALASGGNHIPSDALTINGQPGLFYNCSERGN